MIRRTSTGWRVEGAFPALPTDTVDNLGHALVLADLLADDIVPGPRPPRSPGDLDEVDRLRRSVRQLEHALASRVIVEQAIGVLSERWRVAPRDAFEQLRRVTRSRGLRIHDLAKLVIESSTDPDVGLPSELIPLQRGADEPRTADEPRPADGRRADEPPAGEPMADEPMADEPMADEPRTADGRRSDEPRRADELRSAEPRPDEPCRTDGPPEPRQSPDGRGRGDGRSRSEHPVPAQAQSNGGRPPVQAMPVSGSSSGRHAHFPG